MKTHLTRRIPMAVAMALALATLALGFLAALGVRSLVIERVFADPAAPNPGHGWSQVEYHGTSGSDLWLGTTTSDALELHVNSDRALRVEPNATSPNVIGGYSGNWLASGEYGVTIAGGGASGAENRVTDDYGTVSGGRNNRAGDDISQPLEGNYATVGGGSSNEAKASYGTIGGGNSNVVGAPYGTVGGGQDNSAGFRGTVGGGQDNSAGLRGTVGGGAQNTASLYSTVGGGEANTASGSHAAIGGGEANTASGSRATVAGGDSNVASAQWATVSGGQSNEATAEYATIGGGGESLPGNPATANRVTDDYGTVGGGGNNQAGDDAGTTADRPYATVSGGGSNSASSEGATVGGGEGNTATGPHATVAGGEQNDASNWHATVGGGYRNIAGTADGFYTTVGGGYLNAAGNKSATVGGGRENSASGYRATVSGGYLNGASWHYATVGGGRNNGARDYDATVGGGSSNTASGMASTVGGGSNNTASTYADFGTIGGGSGNHADGYAATVPGGSGNTANGDYSFAVGRHAKVNVAHDGAFLFADQSGFDFNSAAGNEFAVRSTGGARFVTAIDGSGNPTAGVTLAAGGNAWGAISDRDVKANFASVDGRDILERLASIPVESWNLKSQDESIRHIGPMAQDFYAAFAVGEDDRHITTVDADGVALVAIQGLYELSQEKDARIEVLEAENADLRQQLDGLEARVSALEERTGANALVSRASSSGVPSAWLLLGGGLAVIFVGLVLAQRRLAGGRR